MSESGSRGMRTGVEVRDSTPATMASVVTNPRIRLSKLLRPLRRLCAMKPGIQRSSRDGVMPGM